MMNNSKLESIYRIMMEKGKIVTPRALSKAASCTVKEVKRFLEGKVKEIKQGIIKDRKTMV